MKKLIFFLVLFLLPFKVQAEFIYWQGDTAWLKFDKESFVRNDSIFLIYLEIYSPRGIWEDWSIWNFADTVFLEIDTVKNPEWAKAIRDFCAWDDSIENAQEMRQFYDSCFFESAKKLTKAYNSELVETILHWRIEHNWNMNQRDYWEFKKQIFLLWKRLECGK